MATSKKSSGATKAAPKDDLGKVALALAVNVLKSDAVKEQLSNAPTAVMGWARERRAERPTTPQIEGPREEATKRPSPTDRFGQRGLERRVEKLATAVAAAFGERQSTSQPEVWGALDEINRSITIAGGLPLIKRKRMHMRIDDALDELEVGLMNAVMPKP